MAADFGLVTHAAERDAHELASGGARDRFAERSFADARRSDQAQDGPLHLADQGLHREVFEDALLDLFQPVVVFLEDALGFLDVELVLGVLEPGQGEEPVEVVADDGRLGRHRRHHLELLDFALALLARLGRHLLLAQLFFEFLDLVLEFVFLAQFLLNRPHLLVEVVLLLGLLHLLLDPGADALFDLQDFQFGAHVAEDLLQPLGRIGAFEQRLLVLELDAQMFDQLVGQVGRIVDRGDRGDHLGRNLLVQAHVVVEGGVDRTDQRLDLGRAVVDLLDRLDFDLEVFVLGRRSARCARGFLPSSSALTVPSGRRSNCTTTPSVPVGVDVLRARVGDLGVLLRDQQDRLLARLGGFQRLDRLLAADEDRINLVREDDQLAQGQQRNRFALPSRPSFLSFLSLSLRKSIG